MTERPHDPIQEPTLVQRTPIQEVFAASDRVTRRWLDEGRGRELEAYDDAEADRRFWADVEAELKRSGAA